MTQFNRCAVLVSVLLTSFACGGEEDDKGGGGSAKVESGLDGSKPVNTLTQADVEKLGQSYASSASASEVVNAICQFQGVIFSGLGGALGGAGGGAAMQEGP